MALGYIMRPQLSGCDRLGRAGRDRDFLLDKNAFLEPMDCEQFDLPRLLANKPSHDGRFEDAITVPTMNWFTLSKPRRSRAWEAATAAAPTRHPGDVSGFGRFSHGDSDRDDVNEKTMRPLDAEGALEYLRRRDDIVRDRVFLQGWSNGGSTALNVMIRQGTRADGFRAALAFYPGCGREALLAPKIMTSAPITMFLGSDDEEVATTLCQQVAQRSIESAPPVSVAFYPGATHDFDDPGQRR